MRRLHTRPLDPGAPQVHALTIGVGRYPHIDPNNPAHPQFPSLVAPPVAADRVAGFLFALPAAGSLQVGTVESVTTAIEAAVPGDDVTDDPGANFDEIADAFRDWASRCNAHRDNVGVFYFCGHGLRAGLDTLLLPSDYLRNPADIFSKAINFSTTVMATRKLACKTQLYLIDACRTQPEGFDVPVQGTPGKPLMSLTGAEIGPGAPSRCVHVLHACAPHKSAFGFADSASTPFSELVIDAIESGKCAHKEPTRWIVDTTSLSEHIAEFARYQRERSGSAFPEDPWPEHPSDNMGRKHDAPLRHLSDPPTIDARVYFPGVGFLSEASEAYARSSQEELARVPKSEWPSDVYWDVALPAGAYQVGVRDPEDGQRNHEWPTVTFDPAWPRIREE